MRSTLVILPFQDPSTPPLGVALLSAALAEKNLAHTVADANLDFLHYVESGSWGDPAGPATPFQPAQLRTAHAYLAGYRDQQALFQRVSARFSRYRFSPYQMEFNGRWPDLIQVKADALAPDSLWSHWLADGSLVRRIMATDPHWVGLSVNFDGQLPAAMALGHMLKKAGVCVTWGGGLMNAFAHLLDSMTPIWDCTDGVILGAGEAAAVSMASADGIIQPRHAHRLPQGGWISRASELEPTRRPRFEAFPLAQYRSVGRVLPYRVFASCHWGKCAFCADLRYRAHYDRLNGDAELVASELLDMAEHYEADGIHFLDAELPAPFMLKLAQAFRSAGSPLRWGGNSRLSNALAAPHNAATLYNGGCRFLRFGLESASPTVLNAMKKGTTPAQASQVLKAVAQADIGVHVYLMQGFLGEQRTDLQETVDFLIRHTAVIDSFNVSTFQLYEDAPLIASLPHAALHRTGNPRFWSHPEVQPATAALLDPKDVEERFFREKPSTHCFPTTADSIILADKFRLSYTTQPLDANNADSHSPAQYTGQ